MTNKEAIKLIEHLKEDIVDLSDNEIQALDLAIKALREERPQGEPVIKCKDCKHQKKCWHEDKRMKEKGYWIYGCELIGDSFVETPVWGRDNQFCSSADMRKGGES